MKSVLMSNM